MSTEAILCYNYGIEEVALLNYRRDNAKLRRMTALCAALAVLAVGLGAWAVVGQVRLSKLSARVAELEAWNTAPDAQGTSFFGTATGSGDYDASAIAAEFDGGTVTVGEAMEEYQTLVSYYQMMGAEAGTYEENAKMTVLSGLVESRVLEMKAKELGLDQLSEDERAQIEADAQQAYEENLRYYMQFRQEDGKSEEEARAETEQYLEETGYTPESAAEEAVRSATQQRLYDSVTADLHVDDAQLRSFYEEQLANAELTYTADFSAYENDANSGRPVLWHPEGVRRVQCIQIPFDADQSIEYLSLSAATDSGEEGSQAKLDALYAALEPRAQEALDRLNAGESFEALMAEYGSTGPEGGSYVGEKSTTVSDSFRDAAMALASVGDVSGLVRSNGGLCILRYAADVTPGAVAFEDVADELRSGYEDELKLSQYNAAVVQWIADANPKYYTDRF